MSDALMRRKPATAVSGATASPSVPSSASSALSGLSAAVPGETLHRRIRSDLEQRILSGEWPPGHRIPSEHALCERFGCARMTVNKVLTELVQAGMIERRRKAGSFVRLPQHRSAVLDINDIRAEVAALGLAYRFEILSRNRRRSNADDREQLGGEGTQAAGRGMLLDIVTRHWSGDRPFCLEVRLIDLAAVPAAADAAFDTEPPGTWLRLHVPWSSAEHRIRAAAIDAAQGELLQVEPGSPALIVERRTWHAGKGLTWVRFTYPGEGHELVARFSPSMVAASQP